MPKFRVVIDFWKDMTYNVSYLLLYRIDNHIHNPRFKARIRGGNLPRKNEVTNVQRFRKWSRENPAKLSATAMLLVAKAAIEADGKPVLGGGGHVAELQETASAEDKAQAAAAIASIGFVGGK